MDSKRSDDLRRLFGRRLRMFRVRAGLTQMELSNKLGYKSRGTISQIEKGLIGMTNDKLLQLSKILHVPPIILKMQADLPEDRLLFLADVIRLLESPQAANLDAIELLVKNALAKI